MDTAVLELDTSRRRITDLTAQVREFCAAKDITSSKWVMYNDEKTAVIDPAKYVFSDQSDLYVMMYRNKG